MELTRRTWNAAAKLAAMISIAAALIAIGVSSVGEVPQAAIVLPVIVLAFVASWIQTGRVLRQSTTSTPSHVGSAVRLVSRHG